ncbi:MAG TPA: hypothetical protein VHC43_03745 [Mycobacteriales bacterium]|nr:hypothetical protein [Mycobacteriales bacterium]
MTTFAGYPTQPASYGVGGGDSGGDKPVAAATLAMLLSAVGILALSISTLVFAAKPQSPSRLTKWLLLLPPPDHLGTYKIEAIVLVSISAIAVLTIVMRVPAARLFGALMGLAVIGIAVGNIIDLSVNARFVALLFNQAESSTTWVAVTLSLFCVFVGAVGVKTDARVGVSLLLAAGICGTAAGVAAAEAPDFNYDPAFSSLGSQYEGSTYTPSYSSSNSPGDCGYGWSTALDVATSDIVATVCMASDGTANLVASGPSSESIDADAERTQAGWQAVDNGLEYDVDPDVVAVYQNGELQVDEATTNAPISSASSSTSDFNQLADLVRIAHDGRIHVQRLQRLTLDGHCSTISVVTAQLRIVEHNRHELVVAAQRLESSTNEDLPVSQFIRSMSSSYAADRAWGRWISRSWSSWVHRGCRGSTPHGQHFAVFNQYNRRATSTKQVFVAEYDPIAAAHGRRSNWTDVDI